MTTVPAARSARRSSGADGKRRIAAGIAVVAAAIAVAVVVLLVLRDGSGGPTRGPLGTEEISGIGVPQVAGRPFSIGLPVVYNRGDEPATIDRISLVETTPGIEVLETHVAGVDREFLLNAFTYEWPSKGAYSDLHAPRGYVVPPQESDEGARGVELVFVLRVEGSGAHQFSGAQVDYRIGETAYRTVLWEGARICSVRRIPRNVEPDCDPIDLSAKTYEG